MFAKLPSMKSGSGSTHPCICGCGLPTKRTWHTGHDGRATGWARRIIKGFITIDDVPANERNGATHMLAKMGVAVEAATETAKVTKTKKVKTTKALARYIAGIKVPGAAQVAA